MTFTPAMPSPDAVRPDEKEAYERVVARQLAYGYGDFVTRFPHKEVLRNLPAEGIQPYFAALLNSPLIAAGMSDLGVVYRTRGEFSGGMAHADREWVDMVLCNELSWKWVLYVHALDAVAVGVRAEAILALVLGQDEKLSPDEKLRADFIRAVIHGTMTQTLYKALEQKVGVRACVEIVSFTGHLLKTVRLQQAFGMPDITREQLVEFVQGIVDGSIAVPDAKARIPTGVPTPG